MLAYTIRKLTYNVPVFLTIILLVMLALRVNDPVYSFLGKNAKPEDIIEKRKQIGLDKPFVVQYAKFITSFDLQTESWGQPGSTVGEMLNASVRPSIAITLPTLLLTTMISIVVGLISAFFRGTVIDRSMVFFAVLGMSVSFLVYIIFGQYYGAYRLNEWLGRELFAISGYEPGPENWVRYCLLPVMIGVIVGMGYDTRFYRAVMVEESQRDYIITALAKGATKKKVMFAHMLKNAMIPIITRIAISLPFLIAGSILLETFFGIPGMGRTLITAVRAKDFPVVQGFTAIFAGVYILTIILTDILYALVDPRVRLS